MPLKLSKTDNSENNSTQERFKNFKNFSLKFKLVYVLSHKYLNEL